MLIGKISGFGLKTKLGFKLGLKQNCVINNDDRLTAFDPGQPG